MQIVPADKYQGLPCSYVGAGCAYEDIFKKPFTEPMPQNLKDDGWSTLENTNKYIRSILPIKKRIYYNHSKRFTLKEFLKNNDFRCLVCVYGHFVYVNKKDYWSFFNNDGDKIVCIWYIKE